MIRIESIQGRLICAMVSVTVLLSLGMGLLFYRSIRTDLVRGFDRSLLAQASAVSSLVNFKDDGSLDFEFIEAAMPEYRSSPHAHYFIIRFADGRPYGQSPSLKGVASPPLVAGDGDGRDLLLPTGRRGRALRLDFVPARDADAEGSAAPPATHPPTHAAVTAPHMNIIVARDRASLDDSLNGFLRRMILGCALFAAGTSAAAVWIVRRSLRPRRNVAACASRIGPAQLDQRLP